MWPFKKRRWIVVETQIQPSRFEVMKSSGMGNDTLAFFQPSTRRTALVHYRDEVSGSEKIKAIKL